MARVSRPAVRHRRERPPFASSTGGRVFRVALCLASLVGLAYATMIVLGIHRGSDPEALGLPSRQSGEGGQVATVGPLDVQAEDETLSSPSAPASASASPSPSVSSRPVEAPASPAEASPVAPPSEDDSADAPPADDPGPSDAPEEDDDEGKLLDVNLLGIHIAI